MDLALYLSRRSKHELLLGTSLLAMGQRRSRRAMGHRGHMRVLRRRRNIIGDW
jgi:hypothetical protein